MLYNENYLALSVPLLLFIHLASPYQTFSLRPVPFRFRQPGKGRTVLSVVMSEPCPQESGVHDQPRSDAGAAGDCSSQDHRGQRGAPVAVTDTASGQSTTEDEKMPATRSSTFEGRKARYLTMYALECPQTEEERKAFVSQHSLRNGDVVAFSDYRDTDSHVAFEDGDLKGVDLILIRNPDLRNAGYLTIPKEVLANIHDSVGFYGDIITPDTPSVILLMSPKDKFIVDRFGEVPSDWEFYANFDWGELDFFGVRTPGCDDWKEFDPETVTREEIDKWYSQISPCDSESESV